MYHLQTGGEEYNSMYFYASAINFWIFVPGMVYVVAIVTQQTRAGKVQA